MAVVFAPGLESLAPAFQQLAAGVGKAIDPNFEFKQQLNQAITSDPELLTRFATLPDEVTKSLDLGEKSEGLISSFRSSDTFKELQQQSELAKQPKFSFNPRTGATISEVPLPMLQQPGVRANIDALLDAFPGEISADDKFIYRADALGGLWKIEKSTGETEKLEGFPERGRRMQVLPVQPGQVPQYIDPENPELGAQNIPGASRRPEASETQNVPAAAKKEEFGVRTMLNGIIKARESVDTRPESFGLQGFLPGAVLERVDPEGVQIRADVNTAVAEIRRGLAGVAVTPTEQKFIEDQIPDRNDTADTVRQKLNALESFANSKARALFETYEYEPNIPLPSPQTQQNGMEEAIVEYIKSNPDATDEELQSIFGPAQ